jgi:EpsI family protein
MPRVLFIALALILVMQASALRLISISEHDLGVPGLHQLPQEFGQWKGNGEQTLEQGVTDFLRPDEYVLRDYSKPNEAGRINLFVAYFKSLQNTYGPHSPRVCLPASGWLVRSWKISTLAVPGRPQGIPVNEYVLEKSGENILVLYWYQNNRHEWAEEFQAKLKLLPDLIRYRRSDVSLVRLVIPMHGATWDREMSLGAEFAKLAFPSLSERFGSVQ